MRLLLATLLLALAATPALAERKFALVIGNDAYRAVHPLKKAVNDANAVAASLTRLGFAVDVIADGDRNAMSRGMQAFEKQLAAGDTALFFFAGHGFEIRGDNYLLPIDVPEATDGDESLVKDASFAAKDVIDRIQATGAGAVIAILDACRDNPFAGPGKRAIGGETRGLARMDPPDGVFILFSAAAKQEALDNLGDNDTAPNSVFTRVLIETMAKPGLSLVQIAKETRTGVRALAQSVKHDQTPAYYDQMIDDYFLTGPGDTTAPTPAPKKVVALPEPEPEPAPPPPKAINLPRPTSPTESCATYKGASGPERYCASSVLPSQKSNTYGPAQLFDGAGSTAWVPDNNPSSIGEWVTISFDAPRTLTALLVDNGYQKNADIFGKNSRVRTITARFSEGSEMQFFLDDRTGTQRVALDRPVETAWVQVEIEDTYPGWKYIDTALSRLRVEAR